MMRKRLFAVAWAATLFGCAGSATGPMPAVSVPDAWPDAGAGRILQETGVANLADLPWNTLFPIPELQALVEEAWQAGAEPQLARERLALARAQFGIDSAAQWPTLDLAASAARQRAPGLSASGNRIGESATIAAPAAWELDLWGRLADRSEAARQTLLENEANLDAVRISLAAQVASLYFDLLDLDAQRAITLSTRDSRAQSLRLVNARFAGGISSMLDVRQAESLLAVADQSLAEQARRLAQTEHALSALVGRNPGPIARGRSLGEIPLPAEAFAGLPAELLVRRPDVRAAEAALRSARASLEAARKAVLPRVSLTTLLGFVSPALGELLSADRRAWSAELAATLPIFDGGRRAAGVDAAAAEERLLLVQYQSVVRQALREVADGLTTFATLRAQHEAGARVVAANRDRLRIVGARYMAGVANYFEVLDAERQWFDSALGHAQVTRALHQSVVQLYRALGGGWLPRQALDG